MTAVPITLAPEFTIGQPIKLVEDSTFLPDFNNATYDVTDDGRFLMLQRTIESASAESRLTVVLNWTQELLERMAIN